MKIFFFLMLLSNITFFLWEFNSVDRVVEVANNEMKQILLLSELPEKQREVDLIIAKPKVELSLGLAEGDKTKERLKSVTLATEDQILVIPETEGVEKGFNSLAEKDSDSTSVELSELEKRHCYQIGPFIDEKLLINWIKINKIDENTVTTINNEKKVGTGFLVYYPQAETYEKSKQHLYLLKNKGITDLWLFRRGELKGNISLGLFAKESRALVLKNRFVKAGINVEIMTRYKVESEWYAKIMSDKEIRSNMVNFTDQLSFLSSCDKE